MPRRILEGTVVSDKQDKTVTVRITRRVKDDLYGKYITKSAKFAAHDEENKHVEGDVVRIEECRPISKNKSWRVRKAKSQPRLQKTKRRRLLPRKSLRRRLMPKRQQKKTISNRQV